jgi:hypothetical protein
MHVARTRPAAAGFVVAALAALAVATPAQAKPAVPSCALGKLPPALRALVPSQIERGQRHFAASVSSSERARAAQLYATGVAAYLYGMPTVILRLTAQTFPLNSLVGIGQLATPATKNVVAPNHDTLYTVSQVDLSSGPMIIDAPATSGRYSVLQLLDAYTNAAGYVGSGSERNQPSTVAVVPPGWQGSLPAGVRVIHSSTKLLWLLGRTLVDDAADLPAAKSVMAGYKLTPLAAWVAGTRKPELVLDAFPGNRAHPTLPTGLAFYDALGADLAADPPPSRDNCALAAFARAGIGPGKTPSTQSDQLEAKALTAAAAAGDKLTDLAGATVQLADRRAHNGWAFSAPDTARFGLDYSYRAVVGRFGLGANVQSEALYPNTAWDNRGRLLSGKHQYVVSFPAGQLPPVRAFWSVTMYGADRFLVPNAIDRYTIGDRTQGLSYGRGHSLKIYISHNPPAAKLRSNWLPAPAGHFQLNLRLYEPKPAALNGRWQPPTVSRTG